MAISLARSDVMKLYSLKLKALKYLRAFIASIDVAFVYGAESAIQPRDH